MRRRLIVGAALLVLPVVWFCSVSALLTVAALWAQQSGDADAEARSRGRDALWLGHAWVDGRRGPADVERLVARLRDTGIRDLWVHAGPLADDGSLDPARRPYARRLLADIARRAPDVRVSAWLGDVVGPDRLDLTQAPTRERVVASADSVLAEGWAGVHFDLEPLVDGDDDFLAVLDRTRELTRARGALLSVSAEPLEPLPGLHNVADFAATEDDWRAYADGWVRPAG